MVRRALCGGEQRLDTVPMKMAPMTVPSLGATLAMCAAATLPPAPGMFDTTKTDCRAGACPCGARAVDRRGHSRRRGRTDMMEPLALVEGGDVLSLRLRIPPATASAASPAIPARVCSFRPPVPPAPVSASYRASDARKQQFGGAAASRRGRPTRPRAPLARGRSLCRGAHHCNRRHGERNGLVR